MKILMGGGKMNELDSWNFYSIKWVEIGGDLVGIKAVLAIAVVGLLIFFFTRKQIE
jgi:hypothetical protein